jgi:hypothetical protein
MERTGPEEGFYLPGVFNLGKLLPVPGGVY